MKIRKEILVRITIVWLIFITIAYCASRFFFLDSFLKLEAVRGNRDLVRIDESSKEINSSLDAFTSSWAHWTELYNYILGKNPDFIANSLSPNTYIDSDINLLTLWDKNAKLIFGAAVDTEAKKSVAFPSGLNNYFKPDSLLMRRTPAHPEIHGFILLDNKIMQVNAVAITGPDAGKTSVGTIITGRIISPELISKMSDLTQSKIQLYTINEINAAPSLKILFDKMLQNGGHYLIPLDSGTLDGYTQIKDITGKPIGFFKTSKMRLVYRTGLRAINYYLGIFVLLGILLCLLLLAMLRRVIIERLEKLDSEIADIRANHAIDRRVEVNGNDELSSVAAEFNAMLDTIQSSHEELESRVEQRTQELKLTNIKLQDEINERKNIETELIIHKEHLARLAHYDNLTSLPNRVFFNEIFNKALNHANIYKKTLAILFLDLDRFKNINDALGHTAGDEVLKEVASRLSRTIRPGDVIARLGGDEFIILLNDIGHPKFASPIAEQLLQICREAIKLDKQEFFLSASIGICVYPNDGLTLEDLQRNADMAMYRAKRAGGDLFHYYTKELNQAAHLNIQMESDLRKAIKENEFVLFYQPKVDLKTGDLMGVEALIRWDHPEHGLLNPLMFIPFAEDTGLIMQIGEWVLREACLTNKRWQDEGYAPISMSVNISPKQFRLHDIAELVNNILNETGLAAKFLELEITESAVMDDLNQTAHRLQELKNRGVSISVDDFGTGYTSISYLKKFPINIIKIDASFIKGIPHDANDMAITTAVIGMAHNLGFQVVGEGVETIEQMNFLSEHKCDIIQGYYISRPLPEKKVVLQFSRVDQQLSS
jgi:diguanylate cyclase (GGDEF)-like protein